MQEVLGNAGGNLQMGFRKLGKLSQVIEWPDRILKGCKKKKGSLWKPKTQDQVTFGKLPDNTVWNSQDEEHRKQEEAVMGPPWLLRHQAIEDLE